MRCLSAATATYAAARLEALSAVHPGKERAVHAATNFSECRESAVQPSASLGNAFLLNCLHHLWGDVRPMPCLAQDGGWRHGSSQVVGASAEQAGVVEDQDECRSQGRLVDLGDTQPADLEFLTDFFHVEYILVKPH